jgi:hypothetical protein
MTVNVGERFAAALLAKDWDGVKAVLAVGKDVLTAITILRVEGLVFTVLRRGT